MDKDFSRLRSAITRDKIPDYVPLYEHSVDYEIMAGIMGWSEYPGFKGIIGFFSQMGYDFVPFESGPKFASLTGLTTQDTAELSKGTRSWINEHGGPIQTRRDMEEALWPEPEDAFDYAGFREMASLVPPSMRIIGGCSGGPFEHASFLMGLVPLSMNLYEDPEFMEGFFDRIGSTLVGIAQRLAPLDGIGAYRFGDDMGYKSSTMISPAHLRKYVFPWQKRIVEAVHQAGKPFLLHSCGNLGEVMDDLIDGVGIDAKHSWEDVIMPVTRAKVLWGDRIGILGGVDVDFMCRHTPAEVKAYTMKIMEECSIGGGFALGSGNSIPNYVPIRNYLAMLEAWREFNGMA